MKIGLFALAAAALMAAGCTHSRGGADPEPFLRLDRAVAANSLADSVMQSGFADMSAAMGGVDFNEYSASAAVRVFQPDVERILPSLDSVESVVGELRAALTKILPEVKWNHTFAIVWPFDQSVVYSPDRNLLVALNQYLGVDYPGYAGRYPAYVTALKRPEMIPADIAEALLKSTFPYQESTDGGTPLIYRILHEGAVAYAMTRLLPPQTPLSVVLGLSDDRIEWLNANEAAVWRTMMEGQMVYNTDPALAERLLRRAPSSPAISASAPGQTARFIGLKIVESYMFNNPQTTLSQLLSPDFYNSTQSLIHSKYAPSQSGL